MAMTVEELKKEPNLATAYQEMIREAAEQAEASWSAKSPEECARIRSENDATVQQAHEEYQAKLAMEGTPCLCHLTQLPAISECSKCPDNPKHDPPRAQRMAGDWVLYSALADARPSEEGGTP